VSKSQRDKGAAAEREVCAILAESLGAPIKRKLGQARDGGDDIEIGKFRIEVKRRETVAIDAWCEQVEACTEIGQVPVVVYRRNGKPWRVVLRLEDFIPLMRGEL
jgi:hypothetical protein